jgi:hypothetical protein
MNTSTLTPNLVAAEPARLWYAIRQLGDGLLTQPGSLPDGRLVMMANDSVRINTELQEFRQWNHEMADLSTRADLMPWLGHSLLKAYKIPTKITSATGHFIIPEESQAKAHDVFEKVRRALPDVIVLQALLEMTFNDAYVYR